MPRVYKGSETILKLLIDVPSTSVIDKIKIALFTTDRSIAMEFYADSITLYGNIAYLNAPEWTFMEMQDGIIKYIAQGESDNKPFIFERQSNYILKTSDGFEMSEIMNGYYTKEETDVKLEKEQDKLVSGKTIKTINGESVLGSGNIKVNADLTGYATEQWVKQQGYVTDSDVNDYVGNEIGQLEEIINTKQAKLISGTNIKTINGNDILGEGDITIEGGSGATIVEFEAGREKPTIEEFNLMYDSAIAGKPTYVKYGDGMFIVFADYNTTTEKGLYHLYTSSFNTYSVFWYINNGNNYLYSVKNQVFGSNGVKQTIESAIDNIRLINPANYSELPLYYQDYNKNLSAPMSISKDKSATFLLDGKMYYFDQVNGEKEDGIWTKPQIVDLLNIGSGGDAGTYILECVQGVDYSEWWLNPETYEMEWIIEKFLEYNQDEELKNHNKEVIDAILAGKCKTLYYKYRYYNTEVLLETDENGREHRKAVNHYNYIPMSWNEWDMIYGEEYITFSGKYKNEVQSNPTEYSFSLNKVSGSKKNESENQYFMGNVLQFHAVSSGDGYLLNRDIAFYAAGNDKPVYIDILDENGAARTLLSGKYEVVKDTEYIYAWCIDENANFYLWTFKGSDVQETTATITDLKSTPVDLTPYYTKKEIDQLLADLDLTDYYTKAETDELIANINLGDSTTISSIVSTEVSNQLTDNFKTINGETIIGEGDIVIEAGTDIDLKDYYTKKETDTAISEGKRIGVLECVEQLYDFKNDAWIQYGEDDRMSHNATVIQNALNGAYDIVVYKHFFEQANSQNIFIYVPLNFRYPSHDGYFRATGLLETNEHTGYSSAKLIHMMMLSDGTIGSFGADNVNLLSLGGGSGSGRLEYPTLVSPIIEGEMQFQENYGSYADTASGIACGYKMNRAMINNLWTQNLHLGNDTDDSTIKITNDTYGVDEGDGVNEVYAEFTRTGIKENGQYLSDKYVLKSDYNALLARIEALENK